MTAELVVEYQEGPMSWTVYLIKPGEHHMELRRFPKKDFRKVAVISYSEKLGGLLGCAVREDRP